MKQVGEHWEIRCSCGRKFKTLVVRPNMLCPSCSHKQANAERRLRGMRFRGVT